MTQTGKAPGVLQIPAAATQKSTPSPKPATAKKAPKPPTPRLKLLVRRLPPGLTVSEFEHALGEEWKSGGDGGKIDWMQYKPGKVSKDPAKPSRPSRAYIHVVSADHIGPLSEKVRQTSFLDARNTASDPVLMGPPSLEFAPYAKVPSGRARKDARQGTIDQDSEFIGFLESLTQPVTKPGVETTDGEEKESVATTTPLIQFIRDKKASKAKDKARDAARTAKKAEKETKDKTQAKKLLQRGDKTETDKKAKDRASKEAVKAANQQAATIQAQDAAKSEKDKGPKSERKMDRGSAAAAAKILQRDLGMAQGGGGGGGGRRKKGTTTTQLEDTSRGGSDVGTPPASTPPAAGPDNAPVNTPANAPAQSKAAKTKKQAPVTPTATQAFLKHANPSQGVTEELMEQAFSPFGPVTKVEIDKKKGFGYVDFAEPDGLQKSIAASPVTVAESQVVVLERKNPSAGEKGRKEAAKTGKGRSRGGRGRNKDKAGGNDGQDNTAKTAEA